MQAKWLYGQLHLLVQPSINAIPGDDSAVNQNSDEAIYLCRGHMSGGPWRCATDRNATSNMLDICACLGLTRWVRETCLVITGQLSSIDNGISGHIGPNALPQSFHPLLPVCQQPASFSVHERHWGYR